MKLHLGRVVILSVIGVATTVLFSSCASSEEGVWPEGSGSGDASQDNEASSFGGFGGTGTGVGGSGFSGFGGTGTGGGSGSGFGGTGGFGVGGTGTGGTGLGTGGTPSTGGTSAGTCNPAFCPNQGGGQPCCVSANGPCGANSGSGCSSVSADF